MDIILGAENMRFKQQNLRVTSKAFAYYRHLAHGNINCSISKQKENVRQFADHSKPPAV